LRRRIGSSWKVAATLLTERRPICVRRNRRQAEKLPPRKHEATSLAAAGGSRKLPVFDDSRVRCAISLKEDERPSMRLR